MYLSGYLNDWQQESPARAGWWWNPACAGAYLSSLADSESLLGSLLLGQSDSLLVLAGPLDGGGLLSGDELDVAVRRQVGSDSSVGSVCPPAALHSALYHEVADGGPFDVESLCLGVGLQVLEQLKHVADGLLGEATLGGAVELGLGGPAHVGVESSVRNAVFVVEHVLQILDGSLELEALEGSRGLISVLEVSSQIVNSALSG